MARTFNRQPIQVPYPSKNDVKDYFFNHYEWKGINDDKNFLEVDQNTFQKAENVYVDSEGLLRSRPSLKQRTIKAEILTESGIDPLETLTDIKDFWTFGRIAVYLAKHAYQNDYYLYFTDISANSSGYYDCYAKASVASTDLKLVLSKRKIYVFTDTSLSYFDVETLTYTASAENTIYIPTTKSIGANATTDVESPNALTGKQYHTYLYNPVTGVSTDIFNKQVDVTINGTVYPVTFTQYTPIVLAEKDFSIDSKYNHTFPDTAIDMAVSKDDVIALYSTSTRCLTLTLDGKTFDNYYLDSAAGTVLRKVEFSRDGSLVYLVTTTGIWWLSVYADTATGVRKYPQFVNIKSVYPAFTGTYLTFDIFALDIFAVDVLDDSDVMICGRGTDYYVVTFDGTTETWFVFTTSSWENAGLAVDSTINTTAHCIFDANVSYSLNGSSDMATHVAVLCYNNRLAIVYLNASYPSRSIVLYSKIGAHLGYNNSGYSTCTVSGTDVTAYGYNDEDDAGEYSIISSSYSINSVTTTNVYNLITLTTNAETLVSTYNFEYVNRFAVLNNDQIVTKYGVVILSVDTLVPFINSVGSRNTIAEMYTSSNYIYYANQINDGTTNTTLYTTNVQTTIEMQYLYVPTGTSEDPIYKYFLPEHVAELHNWYLANNNVVYISEDRYDDSDNWLWYLPENKSQEFNYDVTALHPISNAIMAVFMETEVWYIGYDANADAYTYQKSKLQFGLPAGNNVITSIDGTTILFVTRRGLLGLSYQDFVASTEQAASYLSDGIFQIFADWNTAAIRLHLHGFWLICYKQTSNDCYIYDIRTKSWWHCDYPNHTSVKFVTDGTELLYLASNKLFDLDRSDEDYFDIDDGDTQLIHWSIASQKLYLGAVNYYKHIINITLNIAIDQAATRINKEPTMNMQVCNYRKVRNVVDTENFSYRVDMIRTFVKRLNYFKVCEFQYELSNDPDNYTQLPLSLADITVKYKLAGEVR